MAVFFYNEINMFGCTLLKLSICLCVSGSSSCDTSFIHRRAPLYSVRLCSMRFTVSHVSDIALYLNVSTSWYRRHSGGRSANLKGRQNRYINKKINCHNYWYHLDKNKLETKLKTIYINHKCCTISSLQHPYSKKPRDITLSNWDTLSFCKHSVKQKSMVA